MENVFCTVFTPAYNRRDLMMRLYESLCVQYAKNFEWVIVDDGSTDGTEEVFSTLASDTFNIVYKKVENGGKHRAINKGLELASGKVFAIVDSDDWLPPDATKKIEKYFHEIEEEEKKFAGIALKKADGDTEISVGTTFQGESVDATVLERKKYNINGDKFEVFYTEVLRNYPFPSFPDEKFMSEAVVWNRIAADGYMLRWYNDNAYFCNYLEGGLTDSHERCLENSPQGYLLYIKELVKWNVLSFKQKMGHFSLYRKIRRKKDGWRVTAKELDTSVLLLWFMYYVRIIIDEIRNLRSKNGK